MLPTLERPRREVKEIKIETRLIPGYCANVEDNTFSACDAYSTIPMFLSNPQRSKLNYILTPSLELTSQTALVTQKPAVVSKL